MLRINSSFCTLICAIVLTITDIILGQESSFFRKPWPTYSLQNMPQTRFTCHDKILGGYYADPEAQCQMFHVCVKVAGVGVQDFRFLCPNGTAFDQEAQICADWGDVDCEQSVLYYGSDNFDLYRLGSGFESKRAPAAEEDESTFHLQRAESGDVRRFKETRIDQKSRPDQPPNYTKHFETVTRGTFNANNNNNNNNNKNNNNYNVNNQQNVKTKKEKKQQTEITKKPIVSYYTPTSTTSIARTTTTTERNYNDDSKQDLDDIFKGSHSSHFFSNRNGGREDDFLDHPVKPSLKPNDFSDFSKKSEASTVGKSRVTPARSKRPPQSTTAFVGSTTTVAPKPPKKVTHHHSYYNTDFHDYSQYKSTTAATNGFSTTAATTSKPPQGASNANRFNIQGLNDYQTQAKIQPTTYNPNRYKPTTTKYTEFNRDKADSDNFYKTTGSSLKKPAQTKGINQNSTFVKFNELNEFSKIKTQSPQPFQPQPPAKVFEAPVRTNFEPQYHRSRGQHQARVNNQQPEPFRASQRQTAKPTEKVKEKPTVNTETKPRGFASRGSINYRATTQRDGDSYPTTTANTHKKFSTLVPKDKYAPTTFKPSTYKKSYDTNYYTSQQTSKPNKQQHKSQTTTTVTTPYTTTNPYYNIDEDDGQYHPELYEIDYSRNNFKRQRQTTPPTTTSASTTTQKPLKFNQHNPATHLKSQQQTSYLKEQTAAAAADADFSDEDELFKTAQSLNFGAASINKLRADIFKAEKTSQQYNSQYNPHNSITSPKTTTTAAPYTTTTTYFTYPSYSTSTQTTSRPSTTFNIPSSTTTTPTTTTTTRRPTITSTTSITTTTRYTTAYPVNITKSGKHADKKSKKNENKNKKKTSKRPPHADEDTSYDYAYYDSDTLSESPQEYNEYEIQEFTKTKRN